MIYSPALTESLLVMRMKIFSSLLGYAISLGYRRALAPHPDRSKYQDRHSARRINALIPSSGAGRSYLEIGVERGLTFEAVRAELKVCVDPAPLFLKSTLPLGAQLVVSTSDSFFSDESGDQTFDFIFLDGLHTAEATYRDLVGALKWLSPGGTVLVDDVLPSDEASGLPSYRASQLEKRKLGINHSRWYGDVWKVVWLIVTRYPDIQLELIGSGSDEHTQAIVKPPKELSGFGLNPDADLAFMESLNFNDVVTDEGLGALAVPEASVLAKLTD